MWRLCVFIEDADVYYMRLREVVKLRKEFIGCMSVGRPDGRGRRRDVSGVCGR